MARPRRTVSTFLVTGLAVFMTSLDNLVVTMALPAIQEDLDTGLEGLEWTVNGYTLPFAVLLLAGAALGDRYGRRRMLLVGLGLFTAASAAAALADDIGTLVAARAVQGAGGALVVPLTLTILARSVAPERRAVALAGWSAMSGLAIALGPMVGGAIVDMASWQWIFWVNVPIGVVLVPAAAAALEESHGPRDTLDAVGLVLAVGGLVGVVLGLVRGGAQGWTDPVVLSGLVAGTALVVAFVRRQRTASAPMVPPRLFADRGFTAANVSAFLLTAGMFGSVFLLAQFLQTVQGYSPLSAGIRTLPWTVAPVLAAPVAGLLAQRVGMRPLVAAGAAMQAVAMAWLAVAADADVAYSLILPALSLAGIGMGVFFALISPLVLSFVPAEEEGVASGVNSSVRELGVVVGVAAMAALFHASGGLGSDATYVAGLRTALWGSTVLVLGALVAALVVPTRARPHHVVAPPPRLADAESLVA